MALLVEPVPSSSRGECQLKQQSMASYSRSWCSEAADSVVETRMTRSHWYGRHSWDSHVILAGISRQSSL